MLTWIHRLAAALLCVGDRQFFVVFAVRNVMTVLTVQVNPYNKLVKNK